LPHGNDTGHRDLTMVRVTASNPNPALSGGIPHQSHCNSVRGARRPSLWAIDRPVRRPELSAREIEVLIAWLHTDSKAEVGRELFITTSTVSTHLVRIRDKYANVGRPARTKAALAARAIQDGLIDLFDL
jgi:DNA-binding CsgD family transcriptional regulator